MWRSFGGLEEFWGVEGVLRGRRSFEGSKEF